MKTRVAAAVVLMLVAGSALAVDVTGNVKWTDSAGGTHNARRIKIMIVEENPMLGSAPVAFTETDLDGNYALSVDFRPGFTGYTPILFAENDAGYVASDGTAATKYGFWGGFKFMPAGSAHIDSVITGGGDAGRAFGIVDAMFTAWQFGAAGRSPDGPPGSVACRYPAPLLPSWAMVPYYDGRLNIIPGGDVDWDTAMHEYGHALSALDTMARSPGGAHNWGESNLPAHGKDAGARLGWGEGMANWMGIAAQHHDPVGGHMAVGVPNVGDTRYDDTAQGFWIDLEATATSLGAMTPEGESDEMAVARILWDIGDAANEGYDNVAMGHDTLYKKLRAIRVTDAAAPGGVRNVERLHDVWMALTTGITTTYADIANLGSIFEAHNVSPRPLDDFVATPIMTTGGAPTFDWNRQNNGQNETFEIRFFSGDMSTLLMTIAVPGTDPTYTLSAAEWATLSAWTLGDYKYVVVGGDGRVGTTGAVRPAADQTLGYWSGAYGMTLVPTPGSLALLMVGGVVVRARRRT